MRIHYSRSGGGKRLLQAIFLLLAVLLIYGVYRISQPGEGEPIKTSQPMSPPKSTAIPDQVIFSNTEEPPAAPEAPIRFDLLNPAQFTLKAKDFGGHPAYGEAMLSRVCADYFESRSNQDQDLADAAKLEKSGEPQFQNLVASTTFRVRTMEVQCNGVTPEDIRKSGDLMREAAAAGDINAKGVVLFDDFRAADAARTEAKLANKAVDTDPAVYKNWLDEAVHLTEQGNLRSAQLAALITGVGAYGQKDMSTSAMWSMVAVQSSGQSFDAGKFSFETEPYNELSSAERAAATERAKNVFASCCSKAPAPAQEAP